MDNWVDSRSWLLGTVCDTLVISFLAAVLHKKGTREDIENNMPEFLLRSMKKEPLSSIAKKVKYIEIFNSCFLILLLLYSLEWSAIIVDEAHRIKNPKARVTEVMKALKCNVRIGLTGTILQNNMKELWCVMDCSYLLPLPHKETLIKRICDQVFSKFPDFVQKSKESSFETLSDPKYSGKMKVSTPFNSHLSPSLSFLQLLDVLQQYCMASGLDYRRLDGSTKSEERLRIVKEFNSTQDVNICLVSTM
uniref:DNA excision repair protein ERCC-6-like 2 n=1 Tax=Ictidomys tridecemlineatus TaxID=43179 RepID=UPI001A9F8C66|nr:DNA excision repair protein ERCC-6-like 2 [Ictidomys tridecemlineatus]